jgi:hypothetical protein
MGRQYRSYVRGRRGQLSSDLIRPPQVAAPDYDVAWVVGCEFGRDTPPDHAVATYDENSLRVHD